MLNKIMADPKRYSVIIIGAGVAGLTAANFLFKNNFQDILVLEAKATAGGRVRSVPIGDESGFLELGAQWIHGEENDFYRLIKCSGHIDGRTSWEGKGDFLTPNGEKIDEGMVRLVLDWVDAELLLVEDTISLDDKKTMGDTTVAEYLQNRFEKKLRELKISPGSDEHKNAIALFQWTMSFQRIDNSCNYMDELSLYRWKDFEINGGEYYNNFINGAQNFLHEVLVKPISRIIRYNEPVKTIRLEGSSVKVITEKSQEYCSDFVILTASIGVIKRHMSTLFDPLLDERFIKAIMGIGMAPIGKIFLKWKEPWWPEDLEGYQFIWTDGPPNSSFDVGENDLESDWIRAVPGFDPLIQHKGILLGWIGGPAAEFIESLDEKIIGKTCSHFLKLFTGIDVKVPDRVFVSKWSSDPYVLGGYSNRSPEGDHIPDICEILNEPLYTYKKDGIQKPCLLLAGEGIHQSQYSTMHGAFSSGQTQAAKLLQYFQPDNS